MLNYLLRVKALDRLGLAGVLRAGLLILLLGGLVAGLIYAGTFLSAVQERSRTSHVPAHRLH